MTVRRRLKDLVMLNLVEEAVLLIVYKLGSMGRITLSRILDLPEGTVRGILRRMELSKMIESTSRGVKLTERGVEELSKLLDKRCIEGIFVMEPGFLGLNMPSVIVHIRGKAKSIRLGLEERDRAIGAGAKALVAIRCVDGRLEIPGVVDDICREGEQYAHILREKFNLRDGDLILAVFSDNVWRALIAALHVAESIPA
ncbi:MAG: DUF4443 domain-containing protein [Candidatus Bathyarchaeia archaeon]